MVGEVKIETREQAFFNKKHTPDDTVRYGASLSPPIVQSPPLSPLAAYAPHTQGLHGFPISVW